MHLSLSAITFRCRHVCASTLLSIGLLTAAMAQGQDAVLIKGARVIDPETRLDAVRDVLFMDGRITAIDEQLSVEGKVEVVDGRGQVLAPGFIDLHAHGQSAAARDLQVQDGVTTALELEWGLPAIEHFFAAQAGRSRTHYGASVSHGALRNIALAEDRDSARRSAQQAVAAPEPLAALSQETASLAHLTLSAAQEAIVAEELAKQIQAGGLGIGLAHAYYPGASRGEILRVFERAAQLRMPIFSHVRGWGMEGIQEVIGNAAATGAALHIVHVNSTSLGEIADVLALIRAARSRGLDISTEAYPYTAGSTRLESALFDEGWQERMGISYGDIQWQDTGERLTAASFNSYRASGGVVIIHIMREEWLETALANDWVMVASDGMPYAPGAHPRTAGTFSRVLGHYVRERRLLDLPTALAKMTLLPAQRLQAIAPQMARKGRVQVGADADLVLFDPQRIIDTATFESGPQPSQGMHYVWVAGVAVVADGELVADAFPGEAIRGQLTR